MQKLWLMLSLFLLMLIPLSTSRLVTEDNGEHVEVDIVKGWNLVPLYFSSSLSTDSWYLSGMPYEEIKAAYLFDSMNKKYISIINTYSGNPNEKSEEEGIFYDAIKNDIERLSNSLFSAIWIYSRRGGTTLDQFEGYLPEDSLKQVGSPKMYKGWNMFSITFDLIKHDKLRNIIGDCIVTKAAYWAAPVQKWSIENVDLLLDKGITNSFVGEVVLLKVAEDCKIHEADATPAAPPVIPE